MNDIFANIFFCEGVEEDSDLLNITGVFAVTSASNNSARMRATPFTILVNATVFVEDESIRSGKSLYYILEAREGRNKKHKLLKEVEIKTFDKSKDNIFQNNTAFVLPNRNLIANPGEYFVRVYYADSNKSTQELIGTLEKTLINSQVLIVED